MHLRFGIIWKAIPSLVCKFLMQRKFQTIMVSKSNNIRLKKLNTLNNMIIFMTAAAVNWWQKKIKLRLPNAVGSVLHQGVYSKLPDCTSVRLSIRHYLPLLSITYTMKNAQFLPSGNKLQWFQFLFYMDDHMIKIFFKNGGSTVQSQ